jgi:hypothetical protein
MNYDPNLTLCGRMATQTVRLTFGIWEYRAVMEVEVGGNCTGMTVIDCAVGIAYQELEQRGIYGSSETYAVINMPSLTDPEQIMECGDDDPACPQDEYWLKNMLIAAEIIAIHPKEPSHD